MASIYTGVLCPELIQQFWNLTATQPAAPVGGANYLLYTYLAGSTTPTPTYTDASLGIVGGANTNPIVLNSAGQASVFLNPTIAYKFVYTTSNDTNPPTSPIYTQDNIWPPLSANSLSPSVLFPILYPATLAEASVTVVNFQYPELTLERYGGGVTASSTQNNTALAACFTVATNKAGGILQCPAPFAPNGTYAFTAGGAIPKSLIIQGEGSATVWQYSGSGSFLTAPSVSSGRWEINDISIYGTGQAGIGITIGDSTANCARVTMHRVVMNNWSTALLIFGTTWSQFIECEFGTALGGTSSSPILSNNIGIAINPTGNNYTSAVSFYDCTISNNATNGVTSSNTTTITANTFTWINCNVQNNCVNATSNPQFFMGLCEGFTIQGMYVEYVLGGTSPSALDIFGLGVGTICDFYINGANIGITDSGGGSANEIDIFRGQILATTTQIALTSDTNILIRDITPATSISVTGAGSRYIPLGIGVASSAEVEGTLTLSLAAASGTITQSCVGLWSQVDSMVFFNATITWTATSSPSGAITITGFPVAVRTGYTGGGSINYFNGITPVSSTQMTLQIPSGSTVGSLYSSGASAAVVAGSAVGSTGSINVSGSYQV